MEKNPVVENLQRPFDWSGFYIGGNVGANFAEYEFRGSGGDTEGHLFSDVNITQQINNPSLFEFEDAGFFRFIDRPDKDRPDREEFRGSPIGGGQIGYQHQFGHFVFGVEGDFDRTATRSTQAFRDEVTGEFSGGEAFLFGNSASAVTDTIFTGRREAQTNWQGSLRGKFGWATGPLLFYGTAGVSFAQVDVWAHDVANTLVNVTFENNNDGALPRPLRMPNVLFPPNDPNGAPDQNATYHVVNTEIDRDDDILFGYTAGFGLEIAFNDAVTLALEYRHNGYGDETFHFNGHGTQGSSGGPIVPGDTKVDFDSNQVTVKMNILLSHFFGNGGGMASQTPAINNVAAKSPFGGNADEVSVGYTKAADADKWSAKDKEVKVEEPFNWTGFYIGANAGGVWTNYDFSHFDTEVDTGFLFFETFFSQFAGSPNSSPNLPIAPFSVLSSYENPSIDRGSDDSLIGGGQVGYQYQFGHFVVGVEGDFSGMSTEKSSQFASTQFAFIDELALAETTLYSERTATVDWNASARLKLGYARGPVMLYVTGGGAWANVRTQATDLAIGEYFIPFFNDGRAVNITGRTSNNTNDEDLVGGWTAGGGGEWAFSKIASLGVEYRHNEFGNADSHYDPHHSLIFADGNHVDISEDQVTVRVNLLLGHMGPGH